MYPIKPCRRFQGKRDSSTQIYCSGVYTEENLETEQCLIPSPQNALLHKFIPLNFRNIQVLRGKKHAQKYFGSFCLTVYVDTSWSLSC